MSQTITEPELPRKRIRELTAAHERAWNERARFLRESTHILLPPIKELTQKVNAPVLALLAEGMPQRQWVAASVRLCVLIDREDDDLLVRVAPRRIVRAASDEATPEEVEHKAHS